MKYLLIFFTSFLLFFSFFGDTSFAARNSLFNNTTNQIPYCNDGECGLEEGVYAVENINAVETQRSASQYIQDVVRYILYFLALIATLIIIYSGFNLLTSVGDEDKAKKSKQIIVYAILGLILIYLAGPLVDFVIGILNA